MKQILIFISLFLIGICTINAQSVTANQMNGRLQMTTVSNVSDSTWSITGYFTNSVNKYLPSNINVNDKFFCQIGANTYVGRISVINSRSDVTKLITFRVICNYPNPPNNIGAIIRATSNGYPVFVDGLPNALQAGIQNYFATLINTNAAGNPCEKTITKTNHQFSKGTPVKRVGGTYVRPTDDDDVPDFIVVDSLTANTFKVSTCGLYTSTLPDGLYWYTSASPGYSLTQDTVKVPLFQVLNDTMILNPIVGFNLMSGSGGTADGNGIYSGSDSLSQENTYAAMAADGSQTYAQGYWPHFPDRYYEAGEYGLYVSPDYYGEVSLVNNRAALGAFGSGTATLESYDTDFSIAGKVAAAPGIVRLEAYKDITSEYFKESIDTTGHFVEIGGGVGSYQLLPITKPSTTSNTVNILKWTAGVPSFGARYESDTIASDVYLRMPTNGSKSFTLGYFPSYPSRTYSFNETGLYVNESQGEVGLMYKKDYLSMYNGDIFMSAGGEKSTVSLSGAQRNILLINYRKFDNKTFGMRLDTTGILIVDDLGGSNNYQLLPRASTSKPSVGSGAISTLTHTAGTPSFLRSQHGVATGKTDGSGDLTVTFSAVMPDATYTMLVTVEGTTSYTISVHTKATGTCKVRFFNPATGAAVTATSVTLSYEAKDY